MADKIDWSNAVAPEKQPVLEQTLEFMENASRKMGAAIILGILNGDYTTNDIVILYGCVNTGTGLNYIISAGAVYYNGVYYEVDAKTFTASVGQVAVAAFVVTQDPVDPIKMQPSGTLVSVHNITKIELVSGATGSGLADFSDFVTAEIYSNEISLATQSTNSVTFIDCTGLVFTAPKTAKYEIEFKGTANPNVSTNNNGTAVDGGGKFQLWNNTAGAELDEAEHYVYFNFGTTIADMGNYTVNSKASFSAKAIVSLTAGDVIKCRFRRTTTEDIGLLKAKMIIKEMARL